MKSKTIEVYKYHRYNLHLLELLTHNAFHCCSADELNDPQDLNIKWERKFVEQLFSGMFSKGINHELLWDKLYKETGHPVLDEKVKSLEGKVDFVCAYEHSSKKFTDMLLEEYGFKVISFSGAVEKHEKSLMWAHYAGYNGVRIKFEMPTIFEDSTYGKLKLEKVKYVAKLPRVNDEASIKKAFIYKLNPWKYENECRIITQDVNKVRFKKEYLKEIIFGNKFSKFEMFMIIKLCVKLGYNCRFRYIKITVAGVKYNYFDDNLVEKIVNGTTNPDAAII